MLKKILGVFIGIVIFGLTLFLLLRSFDIFKRNEAKSPLINANESWYSRVTDMGKNSVPNAKTTVGLLRQKVTKNGNVLYDIQYPWNFLNYRVVHPKYGEADSFIAVAGCSFTFGDGLQDNETLAQMLENNLPSYNVYNLGTMGGGLHTVLSFFNKHDFKKYVEENNGIFIYVFIQHHLNRWYLKHDFLDWADGEHPHFEVQDGKVINKGKIKDQKVYQTFKKMKDGGLSESYLRAQEAIRSKDDFSTKELKDFSVAVKDLEIRFMSLYPKGKFILLFHELHSIKPEYKAIIISELKKSNVTYVETAAAFNQLKERENLDQSLFFIKDDGHPTGRFNEFLVGIVRDFFKL